MAVLANYDWASDSDRELALSLKDWYFEGRYPVFSEEHIFIEPEWEKAQDAVPLTSRVRAAVLKLDEDTSRPVRTSVKSMRLE